MPRRTTQAPKQISCTCGSLVFLVPFTTDPTVMIPVDVDRDPAGDLVAVGGRNGFTVRMVIANEVPEERFRRRAHWATCPRPHVAQWGNAMRAAGVDTTEDVRHDPMRYGPCVRCRQRHPWHYGGPVASPVCDRCRSAAGLPVMGEHN